MKYKLLKSVYRLSDKKIHEIGELVEYDIEEAVQLMKQGFLQIIEEPKTAAEKMTDFKTKKTK